MIYKINDRTDLIISKDVCNKLMGFRQYTNQVESGGVLIGKVKEDYSEVEIVEISTPGQNEDSSRFHFVRKKLSNQETLNIHWNKSNGILNYIGEWHTHPEKNPSPSVVDKKLLTDCIFKNDYNFPWLFMIIVGIYGNLYIGYQTKQMNEQIELKLKERK